MNEAEREVSTLDWQRQRIAELEAEQDSRGERIKKAIEERDAITRHAMKLEAERDRYREALLAIDERETLVEAALAWRDLLADTWVGHSPEGVMKAHCLVTAKPVGLSGEIVSFLKERGENPGWWVDDWLVDFNDAPGRTKQEVLDLVDDFARWLKEREQ